MLDNLHHVFPWLISLINPLGTRKQKVQPRGVWGWIETKTQCGTYFHTKDSYILRTKYVLNFYISINIYFVDDLFSSSNHISCSYHHFSFVSVIYTYTFLTLIWYIVNDMISVIVSHAENKTSTSTSRLFQSVQVSFKKRLFLVSTFLVTMSWTPLLSGLVLYARKRPASC